MYMQLLTAARRFCATFCYRLPLEAITVSLQYTAVTAACAMLNFQRCFSTPKHLLGYGLEQCYRPNIHEHCTCTVYMQFGILVLIYVVTLPGHCLSKKFIKIQVYAFNYMYTWCLTFVQLQAILVPTLHCIHVSSVFYSTLLFFPLSSLSSWTFSITQSCWWSCVSSS